MYVSIAPITMGVQELLDRFVFVCTSFGSLVAWNSSRWHDMDRCKTKKTQNTSSSLFRSIFHNGGSIPSSSHRSHWLIGSVFPTTEVLHMRLLWPFFFGRGEGKAQWIIPPKYATSNLDEGRESWRKSIKPAVKLRAGLWCSQPCRFFCFNEHSTMHSEMKTFQFAPYWML